jgi:integrase/recombinase XerD
VLQDADMKILMESFRTDSLVGLRDRALIATMFYTFARVSAVLALNVGDVYQNGRRFFLNFREKGGKHHPMPAHHLLEGYLEQYVAAAGISENRKEALFRTARGRTGTLTSNRMARDQVHKMVRRRCREAGLGERFGCHTFRASGITNYRKRGGSLEMAQQMAGHACADTTRLYDRSMDEVSVTEVERIQI